METSTIFQGEFYIAITRAAQEHVVATFEESEDHKTLLVIDEKVRTNLFRELRLDDQTIVEAFSVYSEPKAEVKTIFVAPSFDHYAKEFVAKHWGMLMFT